MHSGGDNKQDPPPPHTHTVHKTDANRYREGNGKGHRINHEAHPIAQRLPASPPSRNQNQRVALLWWHCVAARAYPSERARLAVGPSA